MGDVHWFWGDERFVPPDHPDSNFRMVDEALLSVAPIPRENIHPVPTEGLSLADAAAAYETVLGISMARIVSIPGVRCST